MLQFHRSFKNSFTRKISQNPQTPHIQKQPKSGNAKRGFTPSILRSTHDWFIFTHKSLIDENNRFTLNWDKYEAKARAKTQQLDNFPPRLFTSEAKKMFLYFHVGFRVAFESKETRLECRVECASCATLAGWSNFIWSRLRCDFFKGNFFHFTYFLDGTGRSFRKYNKIYLPRKSICFIKSGFMDSYRKGKISFNLNSFSHENFSLSENILWMDDCVCLRIWNAARKKEQRTKKKLSRHKTVLRKVKSDKPEGWVSAFDGVSWCPVMPAASVSILLAVYSGR